MDLEAVPPDASLKAAAIMVSELTREDETHKPLNSAPNNIVCCPRCAVNHRLFST